MESYKKYQPIKEAAESIGLPASYLRRLCRENKIPKVVFGHKYYILMSAASEVLERIANGSSLNPESFEDAV